MNLRMNGEQRRFPEDIRTLGQLIEALRVPSEGVAVERNGEIVGPEAFADTPLEENDTLEIVAFVGGG